MPRNITIIARKPAKRGRKPAISTLTPEQIDKACEALELGFPQSRIAGLLGIAESTMSRILKRGGEVSERLSLAKAEGVKNNLAVIQTHAAKSWQAAAWLLERCNGSEFAQPSAQSGQSVQINLQNVLAAQAHRPVEKIKRAD